MKIVFLAPFGIRPKGTVIVRTNMSDFARMNAGSMERIRKRDQ